MSDERPPELVLGTVQLGLPYGAANRSGKPSREAALRLVRQAVDAGVRSFDTARAYGDSEEILGAALAGRNVRLVTKLSPLSELAPTAKPDEVRAAVDRSTVLSMAALRHGRLDTLLLHRAEHLRAFGGGVWQRLVELHHDGTIGTLGVSVQSPEETHVALAHEQIRHIQMPFNLLDWRWHEAGVIDRLRARPDVTVHLRSIFLQGLLVSHDAAIWPPIGNVDARQIVQAIDDLASEFGRESAADFCLAYARGQDWADGVVIGMETEDQLRANLGLIEFRPLDPESCRMIAARLPRVPLPLLNPALWPQREQKHAA
ncbi:MAG TPA: aldo/keto reductase [Rhizomicrobium sp.]|jgi:spore coat polysaccharide biosynthesis protein SpsF